jgi:hypothetical protein
MPGLIAMHEMGFHRIGAAVELMFARLVKVKQLELKGAAKDLKRPACLKIYLHGVRRGDDVTRSRSVVNQKTVVDLVMGSGANVDGRLVGAFFAGRGGRSDFFPM